MRFLICCCLVFSLLIVSGFAFAQESATVSLIEPANAKTCLFKKVELGVRVSRELHTKVAQFLSSGDGLDPFDPEQVDIWAEFTSPTGKTRRVNGFFLETYRIIDRNHDGENDEFRAVKNSPDWHIRHALDEEGDWTVNVAIQLQRQPAVYLEPLTVTAIAAGCTSKGYVERVHQGNGNDRFLQYSHTKDPFWTIGTNIPWDASAGNGWWETRPQTLEYYTSRIKIISDNQGNFVRLWLAEWTFSPEWEKPGNYATDNYLSDPKKRKEPYYGELANRQEKMTVLDQILDYSEGLPRPVHFQFCVETHGQFLPDGHGWPPARWSTNPYTQLEGVTEPLDFFANPIAKAYFKRRLRYIMARWGYSTSFAVLELMNELDGIWTETVDDKLKRILNQDSERGRELRAVVKSWHEEMVRYVKHDLGYQRLLITTSYANGEHRTIDEKPWSLPELELVNIHFYGKGKDVNYGNRQRLGMVKTLQRNAATSTKPITFAEVGAATSTDVDQATQVNFHNGMWAMSFMGTTGPGLMWHTATFYDYRLYQDFHALRAHLNRIDFTAEWQPAAGRSGGFEYFQLAQTDGGKAIGWVHNSSIYWSRMYESDPDVRALIDNGKHNASGDDIEPTDNIENGFVRINGLKSGQQYRIRYYSVKDGKELPAFGHERTATAGGAKFWVPGMTYAAKNATPEQDFAYTIEPTAQQAGWLVRWIRAHAEKKKLKAGLPAPN